MRARNVIGATVIGVGLTVGAASPALAEPPIGASCQGQFNGFVNPLLQGIGQLNKQFVSQVKALGLTPGQIIRGDAQIHGEDCASLPEGFPTP